MSFFDRKIVTQIVSPIGACGEDCRDCPLSKECENISETVGLLLGNEPTINKLKDTGLSACEINMVRNKVQLTTMLG